MFGRSFQIGKLFGIRILLDPSVLVIFALVLFHVGAGVLPNWHPTWSTPLVWTVAFATAIVFFVSIVLHELSHALVGRAYSIPVRRITLFLFGGAADMEKRPPSAKSEFMMAIVGPITSLAIGLLCMVVVGSMMDPQLAAADPVAAASTLGPVATILAWAGPINVILGLFNLVPGFPLDGGRVLRALVWMGTGDLERATRVAVGAGKLVGAVLIASGIAMIFGVPIPLLGVGLLPGIWMVLIGWFLYRAAAGSYAALVVERLLEGVDAEELARPSPQINQDASVDLLVHERLLAGVDRSFAVVDDDDRLVGMVSMEDVRRVPRADWATTRVGDVMTALEDVVLARPDTPLAQVFRRLVRRDLGGVPVVDGQRLVGIVRQRDVMRWLELQSLPAPRPST